MKSPLPSQFLQMLQDLLGEEASDLVSALDLPPITSVRLNRRKPGAEFPEGEAVKWCDSGIYLNERPEFILDPLLHAGAYYVQDASSMIYQTVVERLLHHFPSSKPIKVLDLCAAPGGKTTAMINALPDGSEVTANEYSSKRLPALKENLAKWGYEPVSITSHDSAFFASQGERYDIVAVDAPCSGEGMMRKEEMARTQWSPQFVEECSALQKDIIKNAIGCLKPGGFLIYSTCTFNRKENEENAEFISGIEGMKPIDLNLPEEWGIPRGIDTEIPSYRFMPHKTKGEGLFLTVFRKEGDWEASPVNRLKVAAENKISKERYKTSRTKKDLAQTSADKDTPRVDVDKETALAYLRRESIVLPPETPKGLVTITYKGLPLGEAKNIGSRANNLYPKNWRILKR